MASALIWVATTTNEDHIRMKALQKIVHDPSLRKELVTGNLSEHITAQFCESSQRLGDDAVNFHDNLNLNRIHSRLSAVYILQEIMHVLPQIIFTLRIAQKPITALLYLVSLVLMYQVSNSFNSHPSPSRLSDSYPLLRGNSLVYAAYMR